MHVQTNAIAVPHIGSPWRVFQAEGKDGGGPDQTPLGKRNLRVSVLIVEDEPIISMDLTTILVQLGAEVIGAATSARDAIRIADQLRPTLALMDVRIKGEPDGVEAARIMRERCGVRIVFVTGNSDAETMRRMQSVSGAQIVLKPVLSNELMSAIVRASET